MTGKFAARRDKAAKVEFGSKPSLSPTKQWWLWIAITISVVLFFLELLVGGIAESASLQAAATVFLADAMNYAIILTIADQAPQERADTARLKWYVFSFCGLWALLNAVCQSYPGHLPHIDFMSVVGLVALAANIVVALMLYGFRTEDANLRSAWLCSRNDIINSLAVLLAVVGVFSTGPRWPDTALAVVIGILAINGGWQMMRLAKAEQRASEAVSDLTACMDV